MCFPKLIIVFPYFPTFEKHVRFYGKPVKNYFNITSGDRFCSESSSYKRQESLCCFVSFVRSNFVSFLPREKNKLCYTKENVSIKK